MRKSILAAGLLAAAAPANAQDKPELIVMTYDSFVTEWGPGPAVEAAFEAFCECDLKFVAAGDGAALLARLKLEGERSEADVVLGLDTNLTDAAAETGLFVTHGMAQVKLDLPVDWNDPVF
ncbi:MAG: thiamine ABC transporter substrate-binding protein, partial [Silicimonas sp.]|nr:thiamine ABC transporter substrate-binding protein [Silicimonas sp.]